MAQESGNELLRTDEYGNPVLGAPAGGYTTAPHEGTIGGAGHAQQHQMQPEKEHHGLSGMLHRSGSSSSSSSEDDGEGGRRKKGIKEKIKDKLPGGHHEQQGQSGETGGEQHEKKGIMEKIKEKLPGGDN